MDSRVRTGRATGRRVPAPRDQARRAITAGYAQQGSGARPRQAWATADGVALAGWWWRALAVVIDSFIVTLVTTLASLPLLLPIFQAFSVFFAETMQAARQGLPTPVLDPNSIVSPADQLRLAMIQLALVLAYQLIFLRWRSATPGKILCGLRVVPQDRGRERSPLSWRAAIVRAVVWALPGLYVALLLFQLLDVLFPLWQPRRQALHDLLAQTQVVRPRRAG